MVFINVSEFKHFVESSDNFKSFIKKFPEAYLCAGFFTIPLSSESKESERIESLDYFIPSSGEIATFNSDSNYKVEEQQVSKVLEPLNDVALNLSDIELLVKRELSYRGVISNIDKMIIILHSLNGKSLWTITLMLSNFDFVKLKVNDSVSEVEGFEKINLLSMVKIKKSNDKLSLENPESNNDESV